MTIATGVRSTRTKHGANVDSAAPGWTRWLPLTGVVFAVVAMAGNLTIGDFPDTDTSIGKLTTYYASHHADVGRGGALLGYSVVFFALFGIALWSRVRRGAGAPVIAGGLLLGVAMVAVDMLASSNTYYTLGQIGAKPTTSPQALQAWHITGSVGGVGADSIVFLLAVAAAGILARALPRWLAWSALVLALMHFTPLGFIAFLLFYVWAIAAGIALTVRADPVTTTGETS
jgi:hypothetical protein